MKILQIIHFYPPISTGGTEIYTKSLVDELVKKHTVKVLHFARFNQHDNTAALSQSGNPNLSKKILPLNVAETFRDTYCNPASDALLLDIVREFNPDVIHIQHLLHHSISFIDRIAELRIPIVMTLHDYWYICPQCFLTKGDGALCDGPGNGRICLSCENADGNRYIPFANAVTTDGMIRRILGTIKFLFPVRMRRMARENMVSAKKNHDRMEQGFTETVERLHATVAALNKAFRIIAPSPVLARRYADAGVGHITVIPHGIEAPGPDVIDKDKYLNRAGSTVRFAYLGSILPIKGIHVLIDAFNRLGAADTQLLIYGRLGFDPDYDRMLQGRATDPRIRFMGAFEHPDVFKVLRGIDVVVMPSLVAENYPLVVNEAFMARIPVVASDVGGLNQLINHERNGFLFEKGNVEELAGIFSVIVNNPDMLLRLSGGIAPVKNIAEHAEEIEALYTAAIAARPHKQ